jgi:hypothetical protein
MDDDFALLDLARSLNIDTRRLPGWMLTPVDGIRGRLEFREGVPPVAGGTSSQTRGFAAMREQVISDSTRQPK